MSQFVITIPQTLAESIDRQNLQENAHCFFSPLGLTQIIHDVKVNCFKSFSGRVLRRMFVIQSAKSAAGALAPGSYINRCAKCEPEANAPAAEA